MLIGIQKSDLCSLLTNNRLLRALCAETLGYFIEFVEDSENRASSSNKYQLKFQPLKRFAFPSTVQTFKNYAICDGKTNNQFVFRTNNVAFDYTKFSGFNDNPINIAKKMYLSYDQLEMIIKYSEWIVFSGALMDIQGLDKRIDQNNYNDINSFFTLKLEGAFEVDEPIIEPVESNVSSVIIGQSQNEDDSLVTNSFLFFSTSSSKPPAKIVLKVAKIKKSVLQKNRNPLGIIAFTTSIIIGLYLFVIRGKKQDTSVSNRPNTDENPKPPKPDNSKPKIQSFIPIPILMAEVATIHDSDIPITTAAVPCPPNWDEL